MRRPDALGRAGASDRTLLDARIAVFPGVLAAWVPWVVGMMLPE